MRSFLIAFAALVLVTTAAQAKVQITVDKDNQMMTVAVDGVQRYQWPVSTGNPSHETPNGTFQTFRMEADHFSKEFDDAPMPHSIFFTKVGHAIHGTESESKLGIPVSHGCVRLSRAHAATLYDLVQKEGVLNTTVTLTGSSRIALARLGRRGTAIARGDIDDSQANASAGQPVMLAPRQAPNQYAPQYSQSQYPQGQYPQGQYQGQYAQGQYAQRPDDGYIYPADGSDTGARYPAPRSARRLYDAQAYPQQQQPYYNNPQYASPPPAYQPRPYYQSRGFFD